MYVRVVRFTDVTPEWLLSTERAWLYRDWVIRALNQDVPYDRFVKLQLAADLRELRELRVSVRAVELVVGQRGRNPHQLPRSRVQHILRLELRRPGLLSRRDVSVSLHELAMEFLAPLGDQPEDVRIFLEIEPEWRRPGALSTETLPPIPMYRPWIAPWTSYA